MKLINWEQKGNFNEMHPYFTEKVPHQWVKKTVV